MNMTIFLIIFATILGVGICFCLAVANYAPQRFYDIYQQINREKIYGSLTPAELVDVINKQEFSSALRVHQIGQLAGDAYVRGGDLLLSQNTLEQTGLASYATLAHELGHALQDRDSKKLLFKQVLTIISRILGPFLLPSLIVGIILTAIGGNLRVGGIVLLALGGGIFVLLLVLKLFTISIEKDASKKAMILLEKYMDLDKKRLKMARKLLSSAKLTYWGSFFATLLGWTFMVKGKYK